MKKSLFFKSGISLLILAGIGAASASEASFEGGMYSDLQALQVSAEWTTPTTAVRGAQGPIRSVDVPRIEVICTNPFPDPSLFRHPIRAPANAAPKAPCVKILLC